MLGKRLINTGGVGACTTDTTQILNAGSTQSLALYRFEDNANDTASGTGKFGKGAVFNGSNSEITLPAALSDGSTTDTNCISFWFNVGAEVTSSSSGNEIMSFSKSGSNTGKIALGSTTGNFSNETFSVTSDVANQYTYITETIPAGWNHAVVQWNSSTTKWDIYINGQAKSTSTFGTNEQGKLLLNFGKRSSYYYNGKLDQVRVFNRSLNQNEVTTLYNETLSTINTLQILGDTSCIAAYSLGINANDLSTNYNGTASNIVFDVPGHLTEDNNGTIKSEVIASQESGFSVVKYTGSGTAGATVAHGLGVKPAMIIWKNVDATANWLVYSPLIGNDSQWLYLNLDSGAQTSGSTNEYPTYKVDPTSSVVTVNGSGSSNNINISGQDTIMYCFANIDGYQRIGSYVGNGSANGPFVFTGFEPAWLLIKQTSSSGNDWSIYDNKRNTTNPRFKFLAANSSAAETSTNASNYPILDFLSNGFVIKGTDGRVNTNGSSYLFWAIAANPDTTAPTKANSFKTKIYTGTGSTHAITGLGFKPDFIWTKNRDTTDSSALVDSVSGIISPAPYLASNSTAAQATSSNMPTSVQADGYTITGAGGRTNTSGEDYVSWNWKALDHDRNLASINNDGGNPTVVSVNEAAGFGIVTGRIAASGFAVTSGHGFEVKPELIIYKPITMTAHFYAYSEYGGSLLGTNNVLKFSGSDAASSDSLFNITNTTFVAGATASAHNFIAYCFRSISGYSKIGTYSGSGNSQTIYVTSNGTSSGSGGFQPAWLLIKNITSGSSNWMIYDAVRDTDGTLSLFLEANTSDAEASASTATITPISNGFTIGNSNSGHINDSTDNYLYMAFK